MNNATVETMAFKEVSYITDYYFFSSFFTDLYFSCISNKLFYFIAK